MAGIRCTHEARARIAVVACMLCWLSISSTAHAHVINLGILYESDQHARNMDSIITDAVQFANNQSRSLHNASIEAVFSTDTNSTLFNAIIAGCYSPIWKDIVILIGACKSREIMTSVTLELAMILIVCTDDDQTYRMITPVQLTHFGQTAIRADQAFIHITETLIRKERWKRFLFIHDGAYELFAESIFDMMSTMGIEVINIKINEGFNRSVTWDILTETKRWAHQKNYIVACGEQSTAAILQQAKELDVLGPDYNWLLVYEGSLDIIARHLKHGDDVALVMNVDTHQEIVRRNIQEALLVSLYYLSLTSSNASRVDYNVCGSSKGHGYPTSKPIILDAMDIDPELALLCLNCTSAVIKKCVLCDDGEPLQTVARWDGVNQLTVTMPVFPKTFPGFHGRTLKVVTIHYPPFTTRTFTENGTVVYGGLCVEILRALAEKLDFRYELIHVVDNKFGIEEKGRWNGIVGMIHRREADLAAAGLTISKARDAVIDYTVPYWEEPSAVLLKRPDDRYRFLFIFKPFHPTVWLCILASIVVSFVCLWMFTRYSPYYEKHRVNSHRYLPLQKIQHCAWYTVGAFLQQGGILLPEASSGRLIVAFFWIFSIVSFATYTGNLIAFLTVSKEDVGIHTLDDLAGQSDLSFGTQDGIVQHMLFKTSDSGVYKRMWDKMKMDPNALVKSNSEGFARVKSGTYAYIGEKTNFEAETANDCNFTFLDEEFYKTNFGFALHEGSPYTIHFSLALTSLLEGGLVERWKQMHWPQNERCDGLNTGALAKVVSMKDAQGLVYVLAGGIALSCLVFIAEHVVRFAARKYNRAMTPSGEPFYISNENLLRT